MKEPMPDDNSNIAIKDRLVAAVLSADRETLRTLIDPAFEMHQPPGTVYAGAYHGIDGFFKFLDRFTAAYELDALDSTALYVEQGDPDSLALGFNIRGVNRNTRLAFHSPQFECWRFRDGRLAYVRVFWFCTPDRIPDLPP